jgi:uncharacterized protein (DUF433 family)
MSAGIGTGIYTPREVSRLAGLSSSRVTRWARGYSFRSSGSSRRSEPVIAREPDHTQSLNFLDLVEVLFVKSFLEHGVKMRTIRCAAEKAVELFGTHHPFAVKKFETDGRTVFARLEDRDKSHERILDIVRGQSEFLAVVSRYLKQIDYDYAGEASRWWPLGKSEPIVVDPKLSFGTPVTAAGHVPTFAIFGALTAGESAEKVADWYDIPVREVGAAKKFEQRMAA